VSPTEEPGSLSRGFAAIWSGKAIVLILTLTTIVLSLLTAAPLGPSLRDAFGRTLAGDHILKNHPIFAPTDVLDFLREKESTVAGVRAAGDWAGLLFLIQQILLVGGIVTVLGTGEPFSAAAFVSGIKRNAWHNVKCFFLFLLIAVIPIGGWIWLASTVSRKAFAAVLPWSFSRLAWRSFTWLITLLLYAVFSLLHDFARAARRYDTAVGTWRAYGRALRMLSGRWLRALVLFFFWFLLGLVLLAGGVLLEWTAPAVSAFAIFVHVLLQVIVLAVRPVVRVGAWGSYLALSDGAWPAAAPAAPVPVPPPKAAPLLTLEEHPLI
jgi:hypothetical protein